MDTFKIFLSTIFFSSLLLAKTTINPFTISDNLEQLSLGNSNIFSSESSIKNYYKIFNNQLIWSDKNGIKDISITLLETIKNDPVLKPNLKIAFNFDEILEQLSNLENSDNSSVKNMLKIDLMLTSIYDKYMNYLSKGYIDWNNFKKELEKLDKEEEIIADWEKFDTEKDFAKLLKNALEYNNLSAAFDEVNYTYPKSKELANKIHEFENISLKGGYIKLPKFDKLKFGDKKSIVKILRERLLQSKDLKENICDIQVIESSILDTCEIYDENLEQAIKSFQSKHGLLADGVLGINTRKYLNIPIETKIAKMRLNLERMRWLPRSLGEKFLLINIPDYRLKMYENNKVKIDMKTVVGTKENPTPIFSHKISYIVLNPYWKIPESIVKKEIIPKLLENSDYLNGKDIKLHENWNITSAQFDFESIDWSLYDETRVATTKIKTEIIDEEEFEIEEIKEPIQGQVIRFIQLPSDKNPLGRMKFMFPNKYSVYLHDTPEREYFESTKRAYSHGCVRLEEAKELLEAIALEDENLDFAKASVVLKNIKKESIELKRQIPVHIVYLTSWIDENNNLQFRDDIYRYDQIQKKVIDYSNRSM